MERTCTYAASDIVVLSGLEAIRRRPGMYVGDVHDGSGLHHLLWELVANSLDEHLSGHARRIRVSVEADWAEVEDDGRGIPIDPLPGREMSALEFVLTTLHAGPTLDGHLPHLHVSPQRFGVGLPAVNALADPLEVEVRRQGFSWKQHYVRGIPLAPLERGPRTESTGTRIRFRADSTIFRRPHFYRQAVRQRLEELAIWNPDLTFELMCERIHEPQGTVRWLDRLADEANVERGKTAFVTRAIHDDIFVEVAAAWSDEPYWELRSFVGQNRTSRGGSHEVGFWQGLLDALYLRRPEAFRRPPRASRWRRRLAPGLLAVVHVGLRNARFAGPTRERLDSVEALAAVRAHIGQAFGGYLAEHAELEQLLLERITHKA